MKPDELIALCDDAIARFNRGEVFSDAPTIMLIVPAKRVPSGNNIRLFGKSGPTGWLAQIKQAGKEYEAVAYFPAIKVRAAVQRMIAA
ncbi:hypothetical protein [Brevundimonas diminuta]|uniref:hypothetical protein n=1 Tax=Brevundimonas diminuta TaxID=293 RepID=UPI0025A51B9D|nr:hypothetical protein [Brevundimonas diminuta]MDM8352847.1 hypothetical protein [Brevundimonas diminuta]